MYHRDKIGLFAIAALIFTSCNQPKTIVANFTPPNFDLPIKREVILFDTYQIQPSKGGAFNTKKGTNVTFPVDAFVYEDGSKVTEPVTIQFREYHTASEILLSGIRMTAKDGNGEALPFESAGMFDIAGTCGDKKVELAEGKSAQILMPNKKSDTDFNFYKLEENGWFELQKNLTVSNNPIPESFKKQAEAAIPAEPMSPEKFDNKSFVFDLDMDTNKYPELKELYGIMWQYNGTKNSSTDPEKNKKITQTEWTKSEITRNGDMSYTLCLRNKKESIYIPVKPVLNGKDYANAKARYDQKLKNYQDAVTRKEEAAKLLDIQSEYARQLSISGFGVYNCDRFYRMPEAETLKPTFAMNSKKFPDGAFLFHIAKEDVVIRLYDIHQEFKYSKKEKNRLIAILPDQTIAVVSAADFTSSVDNVAGVTFNFKLTALGKITPEKLGDIISSI